MVDVPFAALVYANLALVLATAVHASTGLGFGLIAVPLLAVISIHLVPGAALLVSLVLMCGILLNEWRHVRFAEVKWLVPSVLAGTALAIGILRASPGADLRLICAAAIAVSIVLSFVSAPIPRGPAQLSASGIGVGLMGTLVGMHGPPLAVLYQNEPVKNTRSTLAAVFLFGGLMSLAGLVTAGSFGWYDAFFALCLLPGVVFGYMISRSLMWTLPVSATKPLMLTCAAVSAGVLLFQSLGA
ncbi:MAG: sulfite exporter TauE/SafE family protein [Pseudomonadota bacterium]